MSQKPYFGGFLLWYVARVDGMVTFSLVRQGSDLNCARNLLSMIIIRIDAFFSVKLIRLRA